MTRTESCKRAGRRDVALDLEGAIANLETASVVLRRLFDRVDEHRDRLAALAPEPASAAKARLQGLRDEWTMLLALY